MSDNQLHGAAGANTNEADPGAGENVNLGPDIPGVGETGGGPGAGGSTGVGYEGGTAGGGATGSGEGGDLAGRDFATEGSRGGATTSGTDIGSSSS